MTVASSPPPLPLRGVRVVEAGIALAGPFVGSLLAELGAEVIKVERPEGGDPMRLMGPRVKGVPLWWGVAARNKTCIALDLKAEEGRSAFRDLLASADVLVENYRPGVMERLGFGWDRLTALNPRLVMLSISGFGQTGPEASRPGFGKIAEAFSGIVALTGRPEEAPLHIGFSVADTSAGLMGTFAACLALYVRDRVSGRGSRIDIALYEPLFRMADCQLAIRELLGTAPRRTGSNDPHGWGVPIPRGRRVVPLRCGDGSWIALLLESSAAPALASRLGSPADEHGIVAALGARLNALSRDAARDLLRDLGVAACPVHDGGTIGTDPYFLARGDVVHTEDPVVGPLVVPGSVPRAYGGAGLRLFNAPPPP
jgi:crotonobetainyl-CoA:carnitine CoA-transferase CaiB-like acyl-CoA transferase